MDVQKIELEADRIVTEELDRARRKIIENHVAALGLVFVLILPAAVLAVGAVVVLLRRRR